MEFTWLSIPLDSIWTPSSWDSDIYIQLLFSGNVLTDIPRGVPHLLPRAAESRQGCSRSLMSKQQWRLTRSHHPTPCNLGEATPQKWILAPPLQIQKFLTVGGHRSLCFYTSRSSSGPGRSPSVGKLMSRAGGGTTHKPSFLPTVLVFPSSLISP